MRPRTVTIRFETYAGANRESAKWQAKRTRFIWYVLALATVSAFGCRSAWSQVPSHISDIAWSPDGSRLATIGFPDSNLAKVWDAETGKKLLALSLHNQIWMVTWSPDGRRLATASVDNAVEVWDAERGKELLTVGSHGNWGSGDSVRSVAWSPDGKRLATGTGSVPRDAGQDVRNSFDVAKVWDAERGKELLSLSDHDNSISDVAWSPDGKKLAARSGDRTIKVWDAETGKELLTLSGHTNSVSSVTWSPDGKRLATGSDDRNAKLWDAETGQELPTLSSHSGRIFSVAWSPDGTRLATGSDCNTVRVWEAETGKELLTLEGFFQGCEEMSDRGGPTVTLGIEINLAAGGPWPVAVGEDHAVFYIPAVGAGEVLGVIPVSNGRFAGVRITPSMSEDSVKIEVAALVKANKNLSDATCNEVRAWQSMGAGAYEGKKDEALLLTGLAQLGLPVFRVKVVGFGIHGVPPGGGSPYAGHLAHCDCDDTRDAFNASMNFLAYPGAGKCAEIGKCGRCCRIVPPSDANDVPR
jgi:WD40 repeat protein